MKTKILAEADALINGPRQNSYGTPTENFTRIAALWSVVLGHSITASQAAQCMLLVKVARQIHAPKQDNLIDIAGYAGVIDMIESEK